MTRISKLEKIARMTNAPKTIYVTNARGRTLYHVYTLINGVYTYDRHTWTRPTQAVSITDAYHDLITLKQKGICSNRNFELAFA